MRTTVTTIALAIVAGAAGGLLGARHASAERGATAHHAEAYAKETARPTSEQRRAQPPPANCDNELCGLPCCHDFETQQEAIDFFIDTYLDPAVRDWFKHGVVWDGCEMNGCDYGWLGSSRSEPVIEICMNDWSLDTFLHEVAHVWHLRYWAQAERGRCQWDPSLGNVVDSFAFNQAIIDYLFAPGCDAADCDGTRRCPPNRETYDASAVSFYQQVRRLWERRICSDGPAHMYALIASVIAECRFGPPPGSGVPPEILAWYDGLFAFADGHGPPRRCTRPDVSPPGLVPTAEPCCRCACPSDADCPPVCDPACCASPGAY